MVLHTFQWKYEGIDVKVTGEFDNWSASTTMERTESGYLEKTVELPAFSKVYYKFVVDGHWCIDGQALKEGEGPHENNYVLTEADTQSADTTSREKSPVSLPVLGHGASYVNAPVRESSAPTTQSATTAQDDYSVTTQTNVDRLQAGGASLTSSTNTGSKKSLHPSKGPLESTYDDSGPSPSDPQAVRNARDNPLAEAYTNALDHLPTTEEVTHEVQHVAEVASGYLLAGFAAGAAALGLSTHTSNTEAHPITGQAAPTSTAFEQVKSAANETVSATTTTVQNLLPNSTDSVVHGDTSAGQTTSVAGVRGTTSASSASQTGSLEQAAVAAATSAATNAYNAAGLSGLSGSGVPADSIARDGDLGFTGIGTAVNAETGVVGTSKIVQGADDLTPISDTHTANMDSATAETLLEHHENGAKVERISEHAVLAEVGIGGAAIGTAIVTDDTVKSTSGLSIPAQAAEHLQNTVTTTSVPTDARTALDTPASATFTDESDAELAPALSRDVAQVESITTGNSRAIPNAVNVPQSTFAESEARTAAIDAPVPKLTHAIEEPVLTTPATQAIGSSIPISSQRTSSGIANVPVQTLNKAEESVTRVVDSPSAPTQVAGIDTAGLATSDNTTSRPNTAATNITNTAASKVSQSAASTTQTARTTDTPSAPTTPSKAAAQAASKSSVMRQNARSQFTSESTVAPSEEGGKKKKGLLKRMKSIFGGKQK